MNDELVSCNTIMTDLPRNYAVVSRNYETVTKSLVALIKQNS